MLRYIYNIKLKQFFYTLLTIFLSVFIHKAFFPCKCNNDKIPVLIWWTPFLPYKKRIIDCGDDFRCLTTKNRTYGDAAAYLFYGSGTNATDLPLPWRKEVLWAIFHEESPKNLAFFLDERGQNLFQFKSTFSRKSDLPLTLQYLKNVDVLTDSKYYVPLEEKNKLLDDIAPVLYLQSSCDTPIGRDDYVTELMKYIKVDALGGCLNNKKLPDELKRGNSFDVFEDKSLVFEAKYKFVIAIENSQCDDYITEKLWRPLMIGSIPIYLGSPTVSDWLPNDKSAILIKDYKTMEEVSKKIHELNNNDTLYNEYMQHKILRKINNLKLKTALSKGNFGVPDCSDDHFLTESFECEVCKAAHTGISQKKNRGSVFNCETPKIDNSWRTHWTIGKCQAKVLNYFIIEQKRTNFTNEEFEKLYLEYFSDSSCS